MHWHRHGENMVYLIRNPTSSSAKLHPCCLPSCSCALVIKQCKRLFKQIPELPLQTSSRISWAGLPPVLLSVGASSVIAYYNTPPKTHRWKSPESFIKFRYQHISYYVHLLHQTIHPKHIASKALHSKISYLTKWSTSCKGNIPIQTTLLPGFSPDQFILTTMLGPLP